MPAYDLPPFQKRKHSMLKKLFIGLLVGPFAATANSAFAASAVYSDRASFIGAVGATVTDDYSNPGYPSGPDPRPISNAAMSAVLGETDYRTTAFDNQNIVIYGTYCAGCNGSFELGFTTTSVGNANGVYGVGLDVPYNLYQDAPPAYVAYVTYGDGANENISIPAAFPADEVFFGLTSSKRIKTIHFGLVDGVATAFGRFQIDNLTIANQIPEPETYALVLIGLAVVRVLARRSKTA